MMFRHAFELEAEARAVETAIKKALAGGLRTADLDGSNYISTGAMGDAICDEITTQSSHATG